MDDRAPARRRRSSSSPVISINHCEQSTRLMSGCSSCRSRSIPSSSRRKCAKRSTLKLIVRPWRYAEMMAAAVLVPSDAASRTGVCHPLSRSLSRTCRRARKRIKGAVYYSPCPHSIPLSDLTGMEIYCKLDNLQRTGSFKERGARNALAQLPPGATEARRDRCLRRQSRAGARLSGQAARRSRDGRDADVCAAHQGEQLPEARRARRDARQRISAKPRRTRTKSRRRKGSLTSMAMTIRRSSRARERWGSRSLIRCRISTP